MSHFARINALTGKVDKVLSVEKDYIDSLPDYDLWIQTSYNTYGGSHALGGTPVRKNFAAVGFSYDTEKDAFIPPKPHASWVLDGDTFLWSPPITYPTDGRMYKWNEDTQSWDVLESEGV